MNEVPEFVLFLQTTADKYYPNFNPLDLELIKAKYLNEANTRKEEILKDNESERNMLEDILGSAITDVFFSRFKVAIGS